MNRMAIILALIVALNFSGYVPTTVNVAKASEIASNLTESAVHRTAPLFDNLGNYHHAVSTNSKLAQLYFNQGLILSYGFNHAEAKRSFQQAAELDPNCAMCYWGIALVNGPNINAGMEAEAVPEAYAAMQKAIELSKNASEQEKAYIQALAKRYSPTSLENRKSLDLAYANAMRSVAQRYPEDLDAAVIFVEALMDVTPWNYWNKDGEAQPHTQEILTTLESVLKRNPYHPGANHLYIHAVEASPHPERGIPSADRLANLVPGSGHLVHMPSHIYIRTGRYHDAVVANQRAIAADKNYITQCHQKGLYSLAYIPHNYHFLLAAAIMTGESQQAISAARHMAAMVDLKKMREPGYSTLQHYYAMPLYTLTKFSKWDEILKQPAPAADLKYPTGVWHYARGMAFTAQGKLEQAAAELKQLETIASNPALEKVTIWDINSTASLMKIASLVLAGELAAKQGDYTQAINYLKTAVIIEDNLSYDEPATWYSPVRQSLGAVLLAASRALEAEIVYREDLKRYPENGWALFGLAQSLRLQGKTEAAAEIQKRFEQAWMYADTMLIAS
jgi:tetratricopeptide (TPR) repeat protein